MHAGIGRRGNVWRWVVGASVTLALASCMVATPGAPGTPDEGGHARGSLVIHGAGDVSLDPSQIPAFGTHGYGWAWSGLGGLFRRDDLTVVPLCPFARSWLEKHRDQLTDVTIDWDSKG